LRQSQLNHRTINANVSIEVVTTRARTVTRGVSA
jgi:hypothetical protein